MATTERRASAPKTASTRAIRRTLRVVQVTFPQVYLACHTRHQRKRSTPHHLSARDAAILAHLDEREPVTPARLAAHLGVARSTLSEALKRLTALGFVAEPGGGANGGRRTRVLLSRLGTEAISDTSVLETPRLEAILAIASPRELREIARGFSALGQSCLRYADAARRARGT